MRQNLRSSEPRSPRRVAASFNNFVQATPVFASPFALSQVPGAPDDNR